MEIHDLPMFHELKTILCSHKIESWQTASFWEKVKLLNVEDTNPNYQSVYRLILRLVKDNYLIIDTEKNQNSCTTYSETSKMQNLREVFCMESISTVEALNLKKDELLQEILEISDIVQALEDFKSTFPTLQFRIDQLKQHVDKEHSLLKTKFRAIILLIDYCQS